ncbi:putative signal peptide protein [Puccinia sorghi]|uniref:Putative signal peptide protein n=1 Tax=Puccinia sorghi TaxID=27349 RepID=A0A0L6U6K3_9BASI|nr:putative signal peptide protein [Puccinia sorghi]
MTPKQLACILLAATIAVPNGYRDIYGPNPAFLPSPRYYPGLEQLHSQFDAPGPYSFYSAGGYYPYNLQFQGPYPGSTFSPYGGPNLATAPTQVLGRATLGKLARTTVPSYQAAPNTPQESLVAPEAPVDINHSQEIDSSPVAL